MQRQRSKAYYWKNRQSPNPQERYEVASTPTRELIAKERAAAYRRRKQRAQFDHPPWYLPRLERSTKNQRSRCVASRVARMTYLELAEWAARTVLMAPSKPAAARALQSVLKRAHVYAVRPRGKYAISAALDMALVPDLVAAEKRVPIR